MLGVGLKASEAADDAVAALPRSLEKLLKLLADVGQRQDGQGHGQFG